jgi:methylase of polypeptide subunit release factors
MSTRSAALEAILSQLAALDYRFTSVTPETHALVNARPENRQARSLRDVFGYSRCFVPELLPQALFDAMRAAGACEQQADGTWRATLRVASIGHLLFLHSSFPTLDADSVFFGPDSLRFARALRQLGLSATRAVDVGAGSGVGGVVLSHFGALEQPVVLADVNPRALELAGVNARFNGIAAETVCSDVLRNVDGVVDLIISNPPYLVDDQERAYRHGGAAHGSELSVRIVEEALARLDRDGGGSLVVYTGVAMLGERDPFFERIRDSLNQSGARYSYEEIDPDVFASELRRPAYAEAERIAVVLLHATLNQRDRALESR